MKSNFEHVPDVVRYAVKNNIRLVINTVNGMRHIEENVPMFEHLRISTKDLNRVQMEINAILDNSNYRFAAETKLHFDYVVRVFKSKKKLKLSQPALKFLSKKVQVRIPTVYFIFCINGR